MSLFQKIFAANPRDLNAHHHDSTMHYSLHGQKAFKPQGLLCGLTLRKAEKLNVQNRMPSKLSFNSCALSLAPHLLWTITSSPFKKWGNLIGTKGN